MLDQQTDYLMLLNGMAGMVLCLTALLLRVNRPQKGWGWLSLAGAGLAASNWLALFMPHLVQTSPAMWQSGLMAVALIALAEFVRRRWQIENGSGPGRWILLPLILLGASGLFQGPVGLDATLRYFLELPASLGAAWAFRRLAAGERSRLRYGLTLAAIMMGFFGLSNLFMPWAEFLPAKFLHEELWTKAGIPLKFFQLVCLWLVALGLWFYQRIGRSAPALTGVGWGWFAPVVLAVMMLLGWLITEWRSRSVAETIRSQLQLQTCQIAGALDPQLVAALPFAPTDRTNAAYVSIREQMIAYGQALRHRSIYSVALRNGKLIFGPENLAVDDPFASPPATIYQEPPAGLREIFDNAAPLIVGPYRDEYGTFISSFAPVLNPRDNRVLLVVGLDLVADDWQTRIASERIKPIALTLVLLLVVTGGLAALEFRNRRPLTDQRKFYLIESGIVVLLGGALTGIISLEVYQNEMSDRWTVFEQLAISHAEKIRGAIQDMEDDLADLKAVFESGPAPDEIAFRTITQPMTAKKTMRSVAWIACEPSGKYIYRFIEPPAGNAAKIGRDAMSDLVLAPALARTRSLQMLAVTQPFPTAEDATRSAVILLRPVLAEGTNLLKGFVAGELDAQAVLENTTGRQSSNTADTVIHLVELGGAHGDRVFASYPPGLPYRAWEKFDFFRSDRKAATEIFPVFVHGCVWAIIAQPGPGFGGAHPLRVAAIFFAGGLVMTLIITLFVIIVRQRQDELELKVHQRTEQLQSAKEIAESASRAKSDFLATISHEIRTPMNGIFGSVELLQRSRLDHAQRELVENSARSSRALLTIINDILDFSKIESGQLQLNPVNFSVRPLVNEIIEMVTRTDPDKRVSVAAEFHKEVPALLHGDAERIRQVLHNLVSNAFKFTAAGSVTVYVTSLVPKDNQIVVRFEVEDTGIGISAEKQKILFQPFQQADSSGARRFGGTGLGLAISRRLVELMGGTIGVSSREGQGSLFWFELDLQLPAEADISRLRVLVAEDHPVGQRLALLALGKLGCTAEAVASGRELLARLKSQRWDIVLLSRQLADMGMEKILRDLGEINSRFGLVGLAASAAPAEITAFRAAGIKVCLAKPFAIWQLREALSEAHNLAKSERTQK
jgi:signal transduction histidine kinase/CheY-like chemotaxis protein